MCLLLLVLTCFAVFLRLMRAVPLLWWQAMQAHGAGSSLYFRAPQDAIVKYVSAMNRSLGTGFSGFYPTDGTSSGGRLRTLVQLPGTKLRFLRPLVFGVPGEPRGEIEVFASRKGHVTDWHFDFQENFTVQLQGRQVERVAA